MKSKGKGKEMSFSFINGVSPQLSPVTEKVKDDTPTVDPNNPTRDMNIALETLKENILLKYKNWGGYNIDKFDINFKPGKKFIKVVNGSSVWGFVAMSDGIHKNIPYTRGDTFKPASWASPAKWARGNIFEARTDWYEWTGPEYLK